MPRFVAYIAASVDGRISLHKRTRQTWMSEEDWRFFQAALARSDAVVVGRNTYLAAAKPLRRRTTYVFSTRPARPLRRGGVTFLDPAKVDLPALFAGYRRVAVVGGAGVYRAMLDRGLIDELYVTVEPLLFGRGLPMLAPGPTVHLRLRSSRRLNERGTLLLRYAVER